FAVLAVEVEGASRWDLGNVKEAAVLQLHAKLQSVTAKNTAQVIRHCINVLNRSLRDAAVALVRKSCDVYIRHTIVDRVGTASEILDSQFLNRISTRINWQHVVNGSVVPHFEFVHLTRRQRVCALHRNVLSSLWIVRVGKSPRCDPTSFVPNIT